MATQHINPVCGVERVLCLYGTGLTVAIWSSDLEILQHCDCVHSFFASGVPTDEFSFWFQGWLLFGVFFSRHSTRPQVTLERRDGTLDPSGMVPARMYREVLSSVLGAEGLSQSLLQRDWDMGGRSSCRETPFRSDVVRPGAS
jgi:hypothetical protein